MITQPDIFLTIGIPTWNRCNYLQENLLSLISEIEKITTYRIEIFISDNASDDETETICRELSQQYSFLRYCRQTINQGANANFYTVVREAAGQYVWLFGDDDLIVEGVIEKIINDIKAFNYPALIIGPSVFDDTQEKTNLKNIEVATLTDKTIFNQCDAISLSGKMSGLIFNKQAMAPILERAWSQITALKTAWPHLVWVILLLNNSQNKLLLLPYGTNYFIAKNWHNLIYSGLTLIEIHIDEYSKLISALKAHITNNLFVALQRNITTSQRGILLKTVIYATYLNGYAEMIIYAARVFYRLPRGSNKIKFALFLLLPLLIPTPLRKGFFVCIRTAFPHWKAFARLLDRLKQVKAMLTDASSSQRPFCKDGL